MEEKIMYIFKEPALITEQFILPSKGKFYGDNFDGTITLKAMTTIEERMRLSASSDNYYEIMSEVVNRCIVDNVNNDGSYKIDSKRFTIFDFDAVCVKLRIISYGPFYETVAVCTTCGERFKYKVDLRELEFNFVPDDFVEPYMVGPLPSSGDTLGCRFLRVQDRIDINKRAMEIKLKESNYIGKPEVELEMTHRIMTINGEQVDTIMCPKYVQHMIAMDTQYYMDNIDTGFYGVSKTGITDCTNTIEGTACKGKALYLVRADDEFFRAKSNY
jgi:hypothetical protein